MTPGRFWRTIRHLTIEQWIYRLISRIRYTVMGSFPRMSHLWVKRSALRLPLPDISTPKAAVIAEIILKLQTITHGETFLGARDGKFLLLNREYDFGGIDGISWRGEFHEGNNPLRRMNLAYMGYVVPLLAGGNPYDLGIVRRILASLIVQNSWSTQGVFRDVWNSYTVSHRVINLLSGLALYRKAGGPSDPEAEGEILEHVRFCVAFVSVNLERDLQFNHLMKNYVALSSYAAMCETVPCSLAKLRSAVPGSVTQNILADGGHTERSPMYHILSLLDVQIFSVSGLFPAAWQPLMDNTVDQMTAAVSAMSLADGEITLMNDSWSGEAPRADMVLATKASRTNKLPITGYVSLSDGGDSVVFDCGPCGPEENPGHAHADFLTIEATANFKRFLVDTGVPTYTAGKARDHCRSAEAHNGPRLGGEEPIEFWKSFRVGRRGYAGLLDFSDFDGIAPLRVAGWQSGYSYLGTEIRRFVGLWPGQALLVADLWKGRGKNAVVSFRIPGIWEENDRGDFVCGETTVFVRSLVGFMKESKISNHWVRFSVEEPAYRIDFIPARDHSRGRSAVLFTWDGGFEPPTDAALTRLFEQLSSAIPIDNKLG